MTTVYIIRHGETNSNLRHTCLGRKDAPLNENGIIQSKKLAERLSDIDFDVVYTSPLERAVNTISYVIKKDIPLVLNYSFIERDYGIWDDMTFDEIKKAYPHEYDEWQQHWTEFVIPGGESSEQVQSRVNEIMDRILNIHKNETVAVVTHLGTARHILSYLLGLTTAQSWLFGLENAKYAVVDIDDNGKGLLKGLNL